MVLDSDSFVGVESCIRVHCSVLMSRFVGMIVAFVLVMVVVLENVVIVVSRNVVIRDVGILVVVVVDVVVVDQLVKRLIFAVLSGRIWLLSQKILLLNCRSLLADPW